MAASCRPVEHARRSHHLFDISPAAIPRPRIRQSGPRQWPRQQPTACVLCRYIRDRGNRCFDILHRRQIALAAARRLCNCCGLACAVFCAAFFAGVITMPFRGLDRHCAALLPLSRQCLMNFSHRQELANYLIVFSFARHAIPGGADVCLFIDRQRTAGTNTVAALDIPFRSSSPAPAL